MLCSRIERVYEFRRSKAKLRTRMETPVTWKRNPRSERSTDSYGALCKHYEANNSGMAKDGGLISISYPSRYMLNIQITIHEA